MPTSILITAILAGAVLPSFALAATFNTMAPIPPGPEPTPVATSATPNPTELGAVKWRRGFTAAAESARQHNKPIFILFSEVPGCDTCKRFGEQVMSHPLIVEAIETLFVPLAVYNNIPGDDRATLDSFGEPEWNNPVVRIVAADRTPLADRVHADYTTTGVTHAMVRALEAAKIPTPTYISLLDTETEAKARRTAKATFAVHCFWDGDQQVGALDGVVGTRIGFLDGQEVVEVEYAPARISFQKLRDTVAGMSCATRLYARDAAQAASKPSSAADTLTVKRSDDPIRLDAVQKYHLSNSDYRGIPMTELQATRVNSALAKGEDPSRFLSPRQVDLLKTVKARPDVKWPLAVGVDIAAAWKKFDAALAAAPIKPPTSTPK